MLVLLIWLRKRQKTKGIPFAYHENEKLPSDNEIKVGSEFKFAKNFGQGF